MPDLAGKKVAYYGFSGPIDSNSVTRISAAFNGAVNDGFDEIQLSISSGGGYVSDGIFLYNHIKALPIRTVMYNIGSVSSIAVVVFVAATERYCSAHSMFLIHPTNVPVMQGMTAEYLQTSLDSALADDARVESILRQGTAITDEVLQSRLTKDVYISPHMARELGIVRDIRELTYPKGTQVIQI